MFPPSKAGRKRNTTYGIHRSSTAPAEAVEHRTVSSEPYDSGRSRRTSYGTVRSHTIRPKPYDAGRSRRTSYGIAWSPPNLAEAVGRSTASSGAARRPTASTGAVRTRTKPVDAGQSRRTSYGVIQSRTALYDVICHSKVWILWHTLSDCWYCYWSIGFIVGPSASILAVPGFHKQQTAAAACGIVWAREM